MTKTLMDKPEYFKELYRLALREIRSMNIFRRLSFPKWQKDILLTLLIQADSNNNPRTKRKILRRKVIEDLDEISKEAWEEYCNNNPEGRNA